MNGKRNQHPIPGFRVNEAERRLLVIRNESIKDVERWIAGETSRDPDDTDEPVDLGGELWKYESPEGSAPEAEDEIGTMLGGHSLGVIGEDGGVLSRSIDDPVEFDPYPETVNLWKTGGLLAIVRHFAAEIKEESNYTLLNYRDIRNRCHELELTPLPTPDEIPVACGPGGLDLPFVQIDGTTYFDFRYIDASSEEKKQAQSDYLQVRLPVLPFLI